MSVSGSNYQMKNGTTFEVLSQSTDSTVVWNNIMPNCSNGYSVRIESGTYIVSKTWYVNRHYLTLDFQSGSKLVAANNLNSAVIYIYWVNNVTLRNVTIDGNAANQGSIWDYFPTGIMVTGNNDLVTNCTIYNCKQYGYWATYSTNNTGITHSHVYNCGANGLTLNGQYDYAYYNDVYGCSDVLITSYGNYTQIKWNTVHETNGTSGFVNSLVGIDLETNYIAGVSGQHDSVIADNDIYDCKFGIFLDATYSLHNNLIENNTIRRVDYADDMIGYWSSGTNNTFRNNTISGMIQRSQDGNAGCGIIETGENNLVTNNTIYANENYGIAINLNGNSFCTYSNNKVLNNPNGIFVWNSNYNRFINNLVSDEGSGKQTNGITVFGNSSGNFFANNTVTNSTSENWSFGTSTNNTLQGNIGLVGYKTLNVTVSGNGSVAESCGTQSLSSISGKLWQFPTSSTIVLTAVHPSSSFYNFTFTNGTITTTNPLSLLMNNSFDVTANFGH